MYEALVFRKRPGRTRSIRRHREAVVPRHWALNTLCPYYTMFPLQFPMAHLADVAEGQWVLDPFCGRGTTLFAARLRGLSCVGIDSNPLAAAIAAAKLTDTKPARIIELARTILEEAPAPREVPKGEFWQMCFHHETLFSICKLRERLLESCCTDDEIALRALILGILHGPRHKTSATYLSNQMPRTYATKPDAAVRFWKRHRLTPPPRVDVLDAIKRRVMRTLSVVPPAVLGEVYLGDARRADTFLPASRRFSWVITSPPYLGMRTYPTDQWLRNWFLGGTSWVDYKQQGQLSHGRDRFVEDLASVWRAVARRCKPQARLIVRFGYISSNPVNPMEVLRLSFEMADAGWRVERWTDAGSSDCGNRQAKQFGRCMREAACEIDVFVRLEA